jgi:hypothetical protein
VASPPPRPSSRTRRTTRSLADEPPPLLSVSASRSHRQRPSAESRVSCRGPVHLALSLAGSLLLPPSAFCSYLEARLLSVCNIIFSLFSPQRSCDAAPARASSLLRPLARFACAALYSALQPRRLCRSPDFFCPRLLVFFILLVMFCRALLSRHALLVFESGNRLFLVCYHAHSRGLFDLAVGSAPDALFWFLTHHLYSIPSVVEAFVVLLCSIFVSIYLTANPDPDLKIRH